MQLDFTCKKYQDILNSAIQNDYQILTVREYVTHETLPERYIVLRHDVDRKVENALKMARIEAERGVSVTYYFRIIDKTFRPKVLKQVERLGHEVGYHYEDVDTVGGDLDAAVGSFVQNLEQFREHVTVDTVSMHGNPLTPYDNRDLWKVTELAEHDLLGEVYLSVDFSDVVYFSDTNRTWYDEKTIVNDWPVGPSVKPMQITSTDDLVGLIEDRRMPRLYLLVHPNRWADSYTEWVGEYLKDTVINAGKWGLWTIRSTRGRRQPRETDV